MSKYVDFFTPIVLTNWQVAFAGKSSSLERDEVESIVTPSFVNNLIHSLEGALSTLHMYC